MRDARARTAFYASTPGYFPAFEHLGLADLAIRAKALSKSQNWGELPKRIDDAVLEQFVVIGTDDTIGEKLRDRFGDVVTDIEFSIAVRDDEDRRRLEDLARVIQSAGDERARAEIAGHHRASA